MQKSWITVLIAAIFEVSWVLGFKYAVNWWQWGLTLAACALSFYLLIHASQKLPVGTAYAVFVGLGTLGTLISGTLIAGEHFSWMKTGLTLLLLVGVVGLKYLTDQTEVHK